MLYGGQGFENFKLSVGLLVVLFGFGVSSLNGVCALCKVCFFFERLHVGREVGR